MIIYKGHKINDVKVAVENITATTPSCNLQEIRITSNGTYTPSGNIDGYNKVVVNVPNEAVKEPLLQEKNFNITKNGTSILKADYGYDGLKTATVNVNVANSGEYDIIECTNLSITANDVEYNQSTTMINYTATCNCKDNTGGQTTTCKLFGTVTSEDFGINTTQENRLITISFTYKNKTATTQIIQGFENDIDNYTLAFEYVNTATLNYRLNDNVYTADHSPFSVDIKNNLGIAKLTKTAFLFQKNKQQYVTKITSLPNCKNVTIMNGMFQFCRNLKSLDLSKFDTINATSMNAMFDTCEGLTTLDLSHFNTSKVTNMSLMFFMCRSLQSLDISSFDTSKVTDMNGMFTSCGFITIDLKHFDTSKVTDMSDMFSGCRSLQSLDLSSFNTSNLTDMSYMFNMCTSLTTLDLSSFDTSNVTDMSGMFYGCEGLATLDLSNWGISPTSNTKRDNMFNNCKALKTIYLRNCLPITVELIQNQLKQDNINAQIITE